MANALLSPSSIGALTPSLPLEQLLDALDDAFGCDFHVVHGETGELVHFAESVPWNDEGWQAELVMQVASTPEPRILADEDALVLLALPLTAATSLPWVAVAPFATRSARDDEALAGAARLLGRDRQDAREWINRQIAWPAHALERLGRECLRRLRQQHQLESVQEEMDKVSSSLAHCYEEISLLHGISHNFRLSSSDEQLGQLALEWIGDCIPARGMALLYLPVAKAGDATYKARTEPLLLREKDCPLADADAVFALVDALGINRHQRPIVVNHNRSQLATILPDSIRQLVIAPMVEGDRIFGYLLAANHVDDAEFGTVEANLLASVSAMLGVHCSNRDLYRQHDEFLASVVRALTSAMDAKDPYTCGHSDRVARVAIRLAQHLGCNTEFLATIYMAGLLHDIGKIGIDDAVLRKTGRLTEAEFEHIKQHPALGYKILADIKQFADVLPAVLHHHEQWDGGGYPCQLAGEQIPYMARIVAVADAYDAMTSDRPYRPGMPEEKVRKVFADGAGKQWDPEVVTAFFAVYDDVRAIVKDERVGLSLDVEQWL